ncbi:rhamnose ABC transporter substrate-binding protein [Mesorhizobium sp. M7A.F.Ca.MR.362.00.0.0]|uniref:rhamnose ABC transporter substrate-binding protein n=1 Tax=Mesorhizobium sp. M7A.F.Ca.MR.362.00.0.0 TaxID=2496779 RepID=UPI000FD1C563|nr:rhamnose ABC transporter substrate-binding protein [Mesorhizobium sp. M7A.F.Ca.MR.362.00.0.0]RUU80619.1 rhamnose ABC transporter substrate-binding protein [Mesorhizobium sp. M7A.F.Ca.MR.362.00.0.0]RWN92241.1 MAG: rhamnose ABC transporter substrate-binding protein [Mesorhizobium sp.]
MNPDRRRLLKLVSGAALAGVTSTAPLRPAFAQQKLRIGLVVKVMGISYFDVTCDGGQQAADKLGNVELVYTGPTAATVEQQIAVIDALVAQKIDALVISANDATALIPTGKKAMQRGIKVISFDSAIAPEGRIMHVNAPHDDLIGANDVRMISKTLGGEGEVAILSATSQATNQNLWIEKMKEEWQKEKYAKLKLVGVVYGDDAADKSYREAQGLIKAYPNLRAIISPTAVGIVSACRAVTDAGQLGKIFVTGHGLPSEMKPNVLSGVTDTFQLWSPADLGYAAVMYAGMLARGQTDGAANSTTKIGRLGDMTVEADGSAYLKDLLVFDKSNIEEWATKF